MRGWQSYLPCKNLLIRVTGKHKNLGSDKCTEKNYGAKQFFA